MTTTPDYAGLEALEQAIIGYWGNRCSDFDGNCPCCQSWKQFDALRVLLERNAALERELEMWREVKHSSHWKARAEAAEAKLAEAMKALDALDRVNRGVDWCDQYEQARRWFAARKLLKENGNGE